MSTQVVSPRWIAWILTEAHDHLTPARADVYEQARRYFEKISGTDVRTLHYTAVSKEKFNGCNAIVISGSSAPWAAHDPEILTNFGETVLSLSLPILGICAGLQLLSLWNGGKVSHMRDATHGYQEERGYLIVQVLKPQGILAGLDREVVVMQVHSIKSTPFKI